MLTIRQPQKPTKVVVLMDVLMNASKMKFNSDGGQPCETILERVPRGLYCLFKLPITLAIYWHGNAKLFVSPSVRKFQNRVIPYIG